MCQCLRACVQVEENGKQPPFNEFFSLANYPDRKCQDQEYVFILPCIWLWLRLGQIMISSLILAPLFFFFGVMFPGIIWLINNSSTAKVAPSTIVLRKIQTQMFKTSGFIMVSFLVAAISTYKNNQDPSIMELKLISTLVTSQLWYISIMICLGNADRIINKTESVNDLRLYYYALFIAHLETLDHIKIPYKSVCKTLAKECHNDYEFNAISWIMDGRRISRLATITFCASAGLLVILGLGIVLAPGFLARLWKMWGKILSWLKRYSGIILYLFAIKLYVFIISANAYELAFVRSLVIETGGVQPAGEEKWGYGQTTAILLWFPFFFSAIKETISNTLPGMPGYHVWSAR